MNTRNFLFAFFALGAAFLLPLSADAALVGNTNQATLSLSPQTGTFNADASIPVSIYLNTNGQNVVVVAAYLNYDKTHFQAVSIDTTASAFTVEAEKVIDSTNGVIKITRGIPSANHVNSANALVAVVNFKALSGVSPSSDNLTFQFASGSTVESNVIKDDGLGTDILSGVNNARYTVTGGTSAAPPTRFNGSPLGTLAAGTTQTTMLLSTDKNATCKYSATANTAYASMTNTFSTTGGTSHSTIITGLQNGQSYSFRVRCQDIAGNVNTDDVIISFSVASQSGVPIISELAADPISEQSAVIQWLTSEATDAQVEYGLTQSYGSQTALNTQMTSAHVQSLANLSPNTTYHFRVKSKNAAGNLATSGDNSFKTLSIGSDTTPPIVVAHSPSGDLPAGTKQTALEVSTEESASCKYLAYGDTDYSTMTGVFSTADGVFHSATISGLLDGKSYDYYVRCKDSSGNASPKSTVIIFKVGSQAQSYSNGSLLRAAGDSKIYLIEDDGLKHWIPTADIFNANHYSWIDIQVVPASALTQYGQGSSVVAPPSDLPYPNGSILKSADSDKIYIIVNNQKRWITHPDVFAVYHLAPNSEKTVSQAELDKYPTGSELLVPAAPDGALIRAKGDYDVYIVKYIKGKRFKRLILSPSVFSNYKHLKWSDIMDVERPVVDSFVTADLVRAVGDQKVYKLIPSGDTGQKRWIKTADAFNRNNFDWDAIYEINSFDRDSYQEGSALE